MIYSTLETHWSARRAVLAPALVGVVALIVAGCGGGSPTSQVASLPSASASSPVGDPTGSTTGGSATSSTSGQGADGSGTAVGRQERLDDTPEEHEAIIDAWDVCLVHHGAKYADEAGVRAQAGAAPGKSGGTKAGAEMYRSLAEPIPNAAKKACVDRAPIGAPELDPNLNAHYRDDMLAEVKCLRAQGIPVHLVPDTSAGPNGLSWGYDDNAGPLPANEEQIDRDCELKAFGGKN